jgi:predicted MFS family arabinose efflux permease
LGLTLGGVLTATSSPRTAFVVVGAGAALTTLLFARVRPDRKSAADIDDGNGGQASTEADMALPKPA